MQIIFLSGTKCLWLPRYVIKFLVRHKKFEPAQSILGPVRGQGIRFLIVKVWKNKQKLEKCLQFYKCNNLKVESHVSNFSQMVAINPETQVFFL